MYSYRVHGLRSHRVKSFIPYYIMPLNCCCGLNCVYYEILCLHLFYFFSDNATGTAHKHNIDKTVPTSAICIIPIPDRRKYITILFDYLNAYCTNASPVNRPSGIFTMKIRRR